MVGCFPEFIYQFSVVRVLVGLQKQFISNLFFSTWACAVGFNNNKISLCLSSDNNRLGVKTQLRFHELQIGFSLLIYGIT